MSFIDRLKSEEQKARGILKQLGYWEPLPGTKAHSNPKLFFPYADAIAFAVDAETLEAPAPIVHVIHSQEDVAIYSDPETCVRAIEAGGCSRRLRGRKWIVVRK